jgi:2-polyprenyl-3-methyl-5-hydroxy-6-metoxy-1,4-benzoquinol methylase
MPAMKLYQQENDEIIARTQLRDPFFRQLSQLIFSEVKRSWTGRILDMGCGAGRNLILAANMGYAPVGVDSSPESLRVARKAVKERGLASVVTLINKDLTKLRKGELGKFDYVILQEIIEHVPNWQKLIDYAYSALVPGGKILITTPHDPGQWNHFDEYAGHIRRYRVNEVRDALKKFRLVKVYTYGFPVHRTAQHLYLLLLRLKNRPHEAKTFRQNALFHFLYYYIGSTLIKFDLLFRFLNRGTTVVAVGEKPCR